MRIQHNIMAMNAYRNYTNNVSAMKKNLEKLSSGYKINRAGDDAAGLAISEKMRAQITGLETAQKNAKDGISLVQTAEGALTEVHDMLNRMVELATQSANGTYDNTTDRYQMQKEVDQLLSEINRIADSSNFNGINLLDGTLGLNKDAFSIGAGADWTITDTSVDISELLSGPDAAKTSTHLEGAAVAAAAPSAVIDLGDLAVTGSKTGDTLVISVGNKNYTLTAAADDGFSTTAKIATLLAAEMNKEVKAADGTTTTGQDAALIGGAAFTATGATGTVTLTFAGSNDKAGGTWQAGATFAGDEGIADTINGALGFDVKVGTLTSAAGAVTGDVVHKATQVDQAKAAAVASQSGIDLTLNSDIVKNGNVLEIDGKKFQFKTSATGFTAADGATTIDLTAEKEENWIHAAADKLSKQGEFTGADSRKWKIGVNGDGSVIHIHQTNASASGKELDTYEKLAEKIKVDGPSVSKTYSTTQITMKDATKIVEGNTISIGDKKYVFTEDANKAGTTDAKDSNIKYVSSSGNAAQNLVDAINDGKTGGAAMAKLDGGNVIVRADAEGKAAPTILGKGLTLQIGDTADSFNQLNVAVQDMHAVSLGIKDLKINTEELAQQATDKIKAAINMVSDVRGTLGATQNRLDHTINNLSVMTENIQDAESTIRDVDVAEEMMAYTKNNILIQSAQAMLAQANQVPQGVLQLLQ